MLSAEPLDDPDDDTLWVPQVVGAELVDQHGRSHGRVPAGLDNPASERLELEDGRRVPSGFIVDYQPGVRVAVEVPSGLLDGDDDGSGA